MWDQARIRQVTMTTTNVLSFEQMSILEMMRGALDLSAVDRVFQEEHPRCSVGNTRYDWLKFWEFLGESPEAPDSLVRALLTLKGQRLHAPDVQKWFGTGSASALAALSSLLLGSFSGRAILERSAGWRKCVLPQGNNLEEPETPEKWSLVVKDVVKYHLSSLWGSRVAAFAVGAAIGTLWSCEGLVGWQVVAAATAFVYHHKLHAEVVSALGDVSRVCRTWHAFGRKGEGTLEVVAQGVASTRSLVASVVSAPLKVEMEIKPEFETMVKKIVETYGPDVKQKADVAYELVCGGLFAYLAWECRDKPMALLACSLLYASKQRVNYGVKLLMNLLEFVGGPPARKEKGEDAVAQGWRETFGDVVESMGLKATLPKIPQSWYNLHDVARNVRDVKEVAKALRWAFTETIDAISEAFTGLPFMPNVSRDLVKKTQDWIEQVSKYRETYPAYLGNETREQEGLLRDLMVRGLRIEKEFMAQSVEVKTVVPFFEALSAIRGHFDAMMSHRGAKRDRQEPVTIHIIGTPGCGKTRWVQDFVRQWMKEHNIVGSESDTVFWRTLTDETVFWEGYTGQDITVYDDIFQSKNAIHRLSEVMEVIRASQTGSWHLNMAACQAKSSMYFLSRIVILTSNAESVPNDLPITDLGAFRRRRTIVVKMFDENNFTVLDRWTNAECGKMDSKQLFAWIKKRELLHALQFGQRTAGSGRFDGWQAANPDVLSQAYDRQANPHSQGKREEKVARRKAAAENVFEQMSPEEMSVMAAFVHGARVKPIGTNDEPAIKERLLFLYNEANLVLDKMLVWRTPGLVWDIGQLVLQNTVEVAEVVVESAKAEVAALDEPLTAMDEMGCEISESIPLPPDMRPKVVDVVPTPSPVVAKVIGAFIPISTNQEFEWKLSERDAGMDFEDTRARGFDRCLGRDCGHKEARDSCFGNQCNDLRHAAQVHFLGLRVWRDRVWQSMVTRWEILRGMTMFSDIRSLYCFLDTAGMVVFLMDVIHWFVDRDSSFIGAHPWWSAMLALKAVVMPSGRSIWHGSAPFADYAVVRGANTAWKAAAGENPFVHGEKKVVEPVSKVKEEAVPVGEAQTTILRPTAPLLIKQAPVKPALKLLPRGARAQAHADETVTAVALAAAVIFRVAKGGQTTAFEFAAFGIAKRCYMTVEHLLGFIDVLTASGEDLSAWLITDDRGRLHGTVKDMDVLTCAGWDISFVNMGKSAPETRDVIRHFAEVIPDTVFFDGGYCKKTPAGIVTRSNGKCRLAGDSVYKEDSNLIVNTNLMMRIPEATTRGDCGMVYYVGHAGNPKFIGMHVSGDGATYGEGSIVMKKDVVEAMERFYGKQVSQGKSYGVYIEEDVDRMVHPEVAQQNVPVGRLKKEWRLHMPSGNEIVPGMLYGVIWAPTTACAPTGFGYYNRPEGRVRCSPMENAWKKIDHEFPEISAEHEVLLREVISDLFDELGDVDARELNMFEACNTTEKYKNLRGITLLKSPGFPYSKMEKPDGVLIDAAGVVYARKGKVPWCENVQGGVMPLPLVQEAVQRVLDGSQIPIFTDTVKGNERLPFEKVLAGEPRRLCGSPLDLTIAMKMKFGAWMNWLIETRAHHPVKIGVNPFSPEEWTALARYLEIDDPDRLLMAGDWRKMGPWTPRLVTLAIQDERRARLLAKGRTDEVEMQNIDACERDAVHVAGDAMFWLREGFSCGRFDTAMMDSLVALVVPRVCFCIITGQKWSMIKEHFRMCVGGDDHVITVSKDMGKVVDMIKLRDTAKRVFNMEYTDTTKTGELRPFVPRAELTFNKREFVRDGEIYRAPLPLALLQELVQWRTRTAEKHQALEECIVSAFHECVHHPLSVEQEFVAKIKEGCEMIGEPLDVKFVAAHTRPLTEYWYRNGKMVSGVISEAQGPSNDCGETKVPKNSNCECPIVLPRFLNGHYAHCKPGVRPEGGESEFSVNADNFVWDPKHRLIAFEFMINWARKNSYCSILNGGEICDRCELWALSHAEGWHSPVPFPHTQCVMLRGVRRLALASGVLLAIGCWAAVSQAQSGKVEVPPPAVAATEKAAVEGTNTEVAGIVTHQETGVAESLVWPTYSPFTHVDNPFPSEGLAAVLSRQYTLPLAWTAAQGTGYVLKHLNIPYDMINTYVNLTDKIDRYRYFRAGIEISLRCAGTMMHSGRLILATMPHWINNSALSYEPMPPTGATGDVQAMTQQEFIALSPNAMNTVTLKLPWVGPQSWVSLNSLAGQQSYMAAFVIAVLVPLRCSNATTVPQIEVLVQMRFVDPEVAGPTLGGFTASRIAQGGPREEARARAEKGTISKVAAATADVASIVSVVPELAGVAGAVASAARVVEGVAGAFGLDRPTSLESTHKMINRPTDSFTYGHGQDVAEKLALDPENRVTTEHGVFSVPRDQMAFSEINDQPILVFQGSVSSSVEPGTIVAQLAMCPTTCMMAALRSGVWVEYPGVAGMLARAFQYWRGGMRYCVEYICPKTVSATFTETSVFDTDTSSVPTETGYGDLQRRQVTVVGDTITEATMPYLNERQWLPILPYYQVQSPTSGFGGEYPDCQVGILAIQLLNGVTSASELSLAGIDINIWVAPGKDMRYYCPREVGLEQWAQGGRSGFWDDTVDYSATWKDVMDGDKYRGHSMQEVIGLLGGGAKKGDGVDEVGNMSIKQRFRRNFEPLHPHSVQIHMGVVHGEEIDHLRTLLMRYTELPELYNAELGIVDWFYEMSQSVGSVSNDTWAWRLIQCFQFWRGSTRIKMVYSGTTGGYTENVVLVPRYPYLDVNGANLSLDRGWQGVQWMDATQQHVMETQVPYYNDRVFSTTSTVAFGYDPYGDSDGIQVLNYQLNSGAPAMDQRNVYWAAGDDFSLGWYKFAGVIITAQSDVVARALRLRPHRPSRREVWAARKEARRKQREGTYAQFVVIKK